MVHGGEHGDERDAVREAEDRYLRPLKVLLDDEARAALAEDALLHGGADGSAGLLAAHGDGDALAEGEAVGLDDEGQGRGLDVGHGCVEVVEDLIGGGGYAVLFHEALGKDLAALYLRRGLRRAEGRHADVLKGVGHAEAEGVVGCDDGEVYARLAREVHGALYIRGAARDADRIGRDAAVARQGVNFRRLRAFAQRPYDRMLSPAPANDQNLHKSLQE